MAVIRNIQLCKESRVSYSPVAAAGPPARDQTRENQMTPPVLARFPRLGPTIAAAGLALAFSSESQARITRIVVDKVESPTANGQSFGAAGQYEKVSGRAFGEVDPTD